MNNKNIYFINIFSGNNFLFNNWADSFIEDVSGPHLDVLNSYSGQCVAITSGSIQGTICDSEDQIWFCCARKIPCTL